MSLIEVKFDSLIEEIDKKNTTQKKKKKKKKFSGYHSVMQSIKENQISWNFQRVYCLCLLKDIKPKLSVFILFSGKIISRTQSKDYCCMHYVYNKVGTLLDM